MKRLYIVRHGESEHHVRALTGGMTDLPLTARGQRQAQQVADHLRLALDTHACSLFTSDLRRAAMTAESIGLRLGLHAELVPGLREFNNGKAAGLTLEQAKQIELPGKELGVDWQPYPDAETWRAMSERVAHCMDELVNRAKTCAIVVTHAGSATAIVKWWLALPEPCSDKVHFEFRPCSVSELYINEWGERTLVRLNDVAHMA